MVRLFVMLCCRIQCSLLTTSRTLPHTQHVTWRGKFDSWIGRLRHRSVVDMGLGFSFNAWIERAIHLVQLPWIFCGMGWFIWHGGGFGSQPRR